jgi:hypothetical protein
LPARKYRQPLPWDDPDAWGRKTKRLANKAYKLLSRAYDDGDQQSAFAWGLRFDKHLKTLTDLMALERMMMLDLGKHKGRVPVQSADDTAATAETRDLPVLDK